MSVEPIEKLKSTSSTSLVIFKKTGVTLVHPDGEKLPEEFEQVKPNKSAGNCITSHISIMIYN